MGSKISAKPMRNQLNLKRTSSLADRSIKQRKAVNSVIEFMEKRVLFSTSFYWNFGTSTATATANPTTITGTDAITSSAITIGNTFGTVATPVNGSSASSGYTGASGTENIGNAVPTGALNLATSAYYSVTLSPSAGNKVELDGVTFGTRSTSTGPVSYELAASTDGFATVANLEVVASGTIANNSVWTLQAPTVTATQGVVSSPTEFRLYTYGGAGNAGSGTENNRIDDVTLTASLVSSNAAPTVTAVSPTIDPTIGGNTLTITGTNFLTATKVTVAGTDIPASSFIGTTTNSKIQVAVPAHAAGGPFDVTVTGTQTSVTGMADQLTYTDAPIVTGLSVVSGPSKGNTAVQITGFNLANPTGVSFGGNAALSFSPVSSTQVNANSSPGAPGTTVDVEVTGFGTGSTSQTSTANAPADSFTYLALPTVTSISPTSGIDSGGTTVTITGSGFTSTGTTVSINGTAIPTAVTFANSSSISFVTPAHAVGTVAVTVSTPGGSSLDNTNTAIQSASFTYNLTTLAALAALPAGTIGTIDSNPIVTQVLSVAGTPVNGVSYTSNSILVDDGTASVDIFGAFPTGSTYVPKVGDEITVSATNAPFNGLPEFKTITNIGLSTGPTNGPATPVAPIVVSLDPNAANTINPPATTGTPVTLPPALVGRLLQLNNVHVTSVITPVGATTFGLVNLTATLADGSGNTIELQYQPSSYSTANAFFDSLNVPTNPVTLLGLVQNFNTGTGATAVSAPIFTVLSAVGVTPERFSMTNNGNLDTNPLDPNNPDLFTTVTKGGDILVTVTRTAADNNDSSATVSYSVVGTTATPTTDFTVTNYAGTAGTVSGNTISGTVPFPQGASSETFTIHTVNNSSVGDKIFSINLLSATNGTGYLAGVSTPGPVTVVAQDTNTSRIVSTSSQPTSTNPDIATVTTVGPRDNTVISGTGSAGVGFFDVEGSGTSNASFGVLTYNDPVDPSDVLIPTGHISTINSIQLETIGGTGITAAQLSSGSLNVYLTFDTTTNISSTASPKVMFLNSALPDGVGTQFGTKYLLGNIAYNKAQIAGQFTAFDLTNLTSSATAPGIAQLITLLNSESSSSLTPFRILVTPADATTAASFEGAFTAGSFFEAPVLRINYSVGSTITIPTWLSSDSVVTSYNPGTSITISSGTIINDPASVSGDSGIAITISGGTVNTNLPSGVHTIHAGAVSIATGSTLSLRYNSTTLSTSVPVLIATGLSIDPNGSLDEANGDIDLSGGSVGTLNALVAKGFAGGLWNGLGGIDSTVAAANHINAIGVAPGGSVVSISGVTTSATDAVAKYTFFGDANLSGHVDGSDYSRIDSAFTVGGMTGWYNGDFNYDTKINGSDYTLIDNAFNAEGTTTIAAQVAAASSVVRTTAVSDAQIATVIKVAPFSKKKLSLSIFEQLEQELSTH